MPQSQAAALTSIDPIVTSTEASASDAPQVLDLEVLSQVSGAGPYGGWLAQVVSTSLPSGSPY